MRPALAVLALALGPVLTPGPAAAEDEIYSCVDASGTISLQTDPCPEVPAAPRVPAGKAPPERPAAPKPRGEPAAPPRPERRDPATVRRSAPSWSVVPPVRDSPRTATRRFGDQVFPTSLAGAAPPAGPSFATPERTWRTFLAAIEAGDRAGAAACLTPAALERLEADVGSLPVQELRAMLSRFTRVEDGGDLGPLWFIYGVRAHRRPKWIFFEQTGAGEWKIAGI